MLLLKGGLKYEFWRKFTGDSQEKSPDTRRTCGDAWGEQAGCVKMGAWSFAQLKIQHRNPIFYPKYSIPSNNSSSLTPLTVIR